MIRWRSVAADKVLHVIPLDRQGLLSFAKDRMTRSLTSGQCLSFLGTSICPVLPQCFDNSACNCR